MSKIIFNGNLCWYKFVDYGWVLCALIPMNKARSLRGCNHDVLFCAFAGVLVSSVESRTFKYDVAADLEVLYSRTSPLLFRSSCAPRQ